MNTRVLWEYFEKNGIVHEETLRGTSEQNGRAERLNRTLVEHGVAMIGVAKLPVKLWPFAIIAANHIRNRIPSRRSLRSNRTPFEIFRSSKPDISTWRVFGCNAWMLQTPANRADGKLSMRSTAMIFLGYSARSKGYVLCDPQSGKIHESRNVIFDELSFNRNNGHHSVTFDDAFMSGNALLEEEEKSLEVVETTLQSNERIEDDGETLDDAAPLDDKDNRREEPVPAAETSTRVLRSMVSREEPPVVVEDNSYPPLEVYGAVEPEEAMEDNSYPPLGVYGAALARIHEQSSSDGLAVSELVFDLDGGSAPVWCNTVKVPDNLKEAMRSKDWPRWFAAMQTQESTLRGKGTYKHILRQQMIKGAKVLPNRWVYAIKVNDDGSTIFKARLVIGGHLQKKGIDYGETFASVVKFASVRLLLAIATRRGWAVRKLDFVAAFLNSLLDEKVYMKQIPGFEDGSDKILELIKALYGLKQSPRLWQQKLREILEALGFKPLMTDSSLYTDGSIVIAAYVDDLLFTGPDDAKVLEIIRRVKADYDVKDFGEMESILGMEWTRDRANKTSKLTQKRYIESVLKRFGLWDCRPQGTPAVPAGGGDVSKLLAECDLYLEAVGSLIYIATCTRPDIAFAVSSVARKMQAPTENDWIAVKRIFRFLRGTISKGAEFSAEGAEDLVLFADADFAGPEDERKSRSGFVIFYGKSPISWFSKIQPGLPASSTVEAEYRSAATGTQELLWLQHLTQELGNALTLKIVGDLPLLKEDNQGAIAAMRNDVQHSKLKHMELRYYFLKKAVEQEHIEVEYCPTREMIADILTKALGRPAFEYLSGLLGVR